MKGQGLNFKKALLITFNLAWTLATYLSFADNVPLPPPSRFGPPGGSIFPPHIPALEADDLYIQYHYERTGTGYWDDHHGDLGFRQDVVVGMLNAVEETVTHHKTNGTQSTFSHSYDFRASWDTIYCPETGQPKYIYTEYTNSCSGNELCSAEEAWHGDSYGIIGDLYTPGTSNVTSLVTHTTDCSTEVIGNSFSMVTRPKGGFTCQCTTTDCGDLVPEHFAMEIGSLYSLDATIGGDCSSNPSLSADAFNQPLPSSISFDGSQNSMTPYGGSFDSSNHFSFSFNVPSSDTYIIYASTNLVNWTNVGQVSASGTGTFTDTNAPSFAGRFYLISESSNPALCQTNPSDIYGFATINVTTNGAFIANPLLPDGGMNIGSLLTNIPQGTTLQLWGQTNLNSPATFSSGTWDQPQLPLIPGSGAFIKPTTNVTIKFTGQVALGLMQNPIQTGYNVYSSILPLTGTVTALGLTAAAPGGTLIYKWNGTGYDSFTYTKLNNSWHTSTPSLNLCEAILILSPTNTSWNQTYTTPGMIGPTISTVVGNPSSGGTYAGDGGSPLSAGLSGPLGITFDGSGNNLWIADTGNAAIRMVQNINGPSNTISSPLSGSFYFSTPCGVAMNSGGDLFVADADFSDLLEFHNWPNATTLSDGGSAGPISVALDSSGNLYCAIATGNIVTKVTPGSGAATIAGNGTQGFSGDGAAATSAKLYVDDFPFFSGHFIVSSSTVDSSGNVYIADIGNNVIRKVDTSGYISTIAGNNSFGAGYSGDKRSATLAQLSSPSAVAVDSQGNLYIADTGNNVIRRVDLNGIITTVAGNGQAGFGGDAGPALGATLSAPSGLAFDASGNLYICDTGNNVIRKLIFNH